MQALCGEGPGVSSRITETIALCPSSGSHLSLFDLFVGLIPLLTESLAPNKTQGAEVSTEGWLDGFTQFTFQSRRAVVSPSQSVLGIWIYSNSVKVFGRVPSHSFAMFLMLSEAVRPLWLC